MLKAQIQEGRRYTRGTVAERLVANSVFSGEHGDPPQPLPCRLTTYALNEFGYGVIRVDGRNSKTHIEAYKVWVGPVPRGMKVTHLCNTPRCFEWTHLLLATQKQNLEYMASCGRSIRGRRYPGKNYRGGHGPYGERSSFSKLTEDQVREIRRLASQGQTHRQIAPLFGITYSNISYIVRRKTWAHIGEAV